MSMQITFDANDPRALGAFWAEILGYREQPPPEGFDSWDAFLDSVGLPADERDRAYAITDPEGRGPRVFLQKVPEPKSAKNRVHLDVNVSDHAGSPDGRKAAVASAVERAIGLGATRLREVDEVIGYCVVMADPEGNEFCLQ